jgi:hypothetical protein
MVRLTALMQGSAIRDTLAVSFPRKRESTATAPSLALDPRLRGGDDLNCGIFQQARPSRRVHHD